MRNQSMDVVIRSEIGFDDDLMRRIVEGTLDIGVMYTPVINPDWWPNTSSMSDWCC